ncbi:unnamed protein product [Linum tenue]|uniref:Cucumisin n=1 Tax=Linum tenue TaxID=586396 RepID=A0AAV0MME8_9ROSI|nr:unnamed protein product [Linum tenue]CAI0447395.1 unnamed protein product [Linum tenue]
MGDRSRNIETTTSASAVHISLLQKVTGSVSLAAESLVHSYSKSFSGFAAKLTKAETEKLSGHEGVVSVFPSQLRQLHTTRSWDFIGFPQTVARATVESDVIIGMLDTGIWPESQSFNASGYGPPPQKWKGTCQSSSNFTCNNKIIGARFYHAGQDLNDGETISPRDTEGHGTHTASTAAGNIVTHASLLGLAAGTARGGVPSARIAVYKICWTLGCSDVDILAAFDDAISDGVDIISLSVGGAPTDYFQDAIAIGAFHSMKNSILTSNSAGNSGPAAGTVSNVSPWSLSVAASTIDRKFATGVKLGNGRTYVGGSINTYEASRMYGLIYGGDALNRTSGSDSRSCGAGSLDRDLVRGKMVHCDGVSRGDEQARVGAVASTMSLPPDTPLDAAFSFLLPVSVLTNADSAQILEYINSTSDPTGLIFKTRAIIDNSSPHVIDFSSRGPNPITTDILKPDLTAPGVDILAAWSEATTVTGQDGDTRTVPFNIISGTSMSCPHASAAAAYVKSFHPTWSPAAIKSALMTTARQLSVEDNSDAEFAYGSGQIDPIKAVNPGLVYDAGEIDYVRMLCGQGYNATQLRLVTGDSSASCSEATDGTVWDLNYPSFALSSGKPMASVARVFHRTVTNVGSAAATTYKVSISGPGLGALKVRVEPKTLAFNKIGEKQSFVVTVEAALERETTMLSVSLVFSDGIHTVRSPIVAFVAQ